MPTTYANLVPVRRVAVGDCDGPLGSGFEVLATSAYAALLRADWTEDSSAPFLPVHDNGQTANKAIPHGDAWKCTYGYNAAARTERSACGCVCYTFALPADATAGTPANISKVSFSVTGDRYLDAGVDVHVFTNGTATPPSVEYLANRTPNFSAVCATSGQAPLAPNKRAGVSEDIEWEPTATAAQAYVHVALLLHDYTTNRGAWIEGGAMLDDARATITFSRDVAENTPTRIVVPLEAGQVVTSGLYDSNLNRTAAVLAPSTELDYEWWQWDGSGQVVSISESAAPQVEAKTMMLTPGVGPSGVVASQLSVEANGFELVGGSLWGRVGYTNSANGTSIVPCASVFVRSGYVDDGVPWTGAILENIAETTSLPIRYALYAVQGNPYFVQLAEGAFADCDLWSGKATRAQVVTDYLINSDVPIWLSYPFGGKPAGPRVGGRGYVDVIPLACGVFPQGSALVSKEIAFDKPIFLPKGGMPLTVFLALAPEVGGTTDDAIVLVSENTSISLVSES